MIMEEPQYDSPLQMKIQVAVRKRPINKKEVAKGDIDIIAVKDIHTLTVREMKQKVDLTKYIEEHNYVFDGVYDETVTNEQLYLSLVRPLLEAAFNKAKVSCFAYGQTGSGKTYTMMGNYSIDEKKVTVPGLYLLASQDIFSALTLPQYQNLQVWVTFYEIYCSKCFDLLNERKLLHLREDAKKDMNLVGISEKRIMNVHTLMQLIDFGLSVRASGQTSHNDDSSRSHAILQINLKDNYGKSQGKISFIDLAGSERASDVQEQNQQTKLDGAEINKSLLALKECIRALDQQKNYTPFRGSKLTLVLRDSFVGNCKTVMIGNISPGQSCSEHTLNTLRYADRVKELKRGQHQQEELSQNAMDQLSRQLMLSRQNKNTQKLSLQQFQQANNNFNKPKYSMAAQFNQTANHFQQNQFEFSDDFQTNDLFNFDNSQEEARQNFVQIHHFEGPPNIQQNQKITIFNQTPPSIEQVQQKNMQFAQTLSQIKQEQQLAQFIQNQQQQMQQQMLQNQQGQQPLQQITNQVPIIDNCLSMNDNFEQLGNKMNNYLNQQKLEKAFQISDNLSNQPTGEQENLLISTQSPNKDRLNEKYFEDMSQRHEQLLQKILQQEEGVLISHRQQIDDTVEFTKLEMNLLNDVNKLGSNVDEYVTNLDEILQKKIDCIQKLKIILTEFKSNLHEEQQLSRFYYQMKNQVNCNMQEEEGKI